MKRPSPRGSAVSARSWPPRTRPCSARPWAASRRWAPGIACPAPKPPPSVVKVVELPPEVEADGRGRRPALRRARARRVARADRRAARRQGPRRARRSICTARRSRPRSQQLRAVPDRGAPHRPSLRARDPRQGDSTPSTARRCARPCSPSCSARCPDSSTRSPPPRPPTAAKARPTSCCEARGEAPRRCSRIVALVAARPRLRRRGGLRRARRRCRRSRRTKRPATATAPRHDGAHARVLFGKELRPAREVVGRREEPLTPEEETAKQIEKLLRGPLRYGVTGLYVVDAQHRRAAVRGQRRRSAQPRVERQDDLDGDRARAARRRLPLHDAPARPRARRDGVDPRRRVPARQRTTRRSPPPTSTRSRPQVAARGVKQLDGDVVVGSDPTRDGIYRAIVPLDDQGRRARRAADAPPPRRLRSAHDRRSPRRPRKRAAARAAPDVHDVRRSRTPPATRASRSPIGGTIGKGAETHCARCSSSERTCDAAHALRAALRAHGVTVNGDVRVAELGDFVGDGRERRQPARSSSAATTRAPLADIVRASTSGASTGSPTA